MKRSGSLPGIPCRRSGKTGVYAWERLQFPIREAMWDRGQRRGSRFIADMLNQILKPEQRTTVLLETMSGKGSEVGKSFEELKEIIDKVELSDHLGVCLDTCHIWDAGYDIAEHLDDVISEFDRIIGLDRLKAIHFK